MQSTSATQCTWSWHKLSPGLINKRGVDVIAELRSPICRYNMQECEVWVWWLVGWLSFINIRRSSGRGQRKSTWLGTVEDPRDASKCRWASPSTQFLWGKQKGKHPHGPRGEDCCTDMWRSCWGRGGYGRPEGEEGSGGCRCAVRWRGEARWEEIQQAIVWRERTGVEPRDRQLSIIQSLRTGTHTWHQLDQSHNADSLQVTIF